MHPLPAGTAKVACREMLSANTVQSEKLLLFIAAQPLEFLNVSGSGDGVFWGKRFPSGW
jgi:hypothetical protein